VVLPSTLKAVGEYAFCNCEKSNFIFKGAPPEIVGKFAFETYNSPVAYYPSTHKTTWDAVIGENGRWGSLYMMMYTPEILLPESVTGVTSTWLEDVLEASGITSCSAVLAEGTTVEALEAARLLGITPSVSVSGDIATVAAESTFEVSEVVVAENAVSLAVTITVEAGELPENPSLGGVVKLLVCDTLGGDWREVTPDHSQIKLTRISDTEARLSVTQSVDAYKFFKVLVK
jgi:hypothetical protein